MAGNSEFGQIFTVIERFFPDFSNVQGDRVRARSRNGTIYDLLVENFAGRFVFNQFAKHTVFRRGISAVFAVDINRRQIRTALERRYVEFFQTCRQRNRGEITALERAFADRQFNFFNVFGSLCKDKVHRRTHVERLLADVRYRRRNRNFRKLGALEYVRRNVRYAVRNLVFALKRIRNVDQFLNFFIVRIVENQRAVNRFIISLVRICLVIALYAIYGNFLQCRTAVECRTARIITAYAQRNTRDRIGNFDFFQRLTVLECVRFDKLNGQVHIRFRNSNVRRILHTCFVLRYGICRFVVDQLIFEYFDPSRIQGNRLNICPRTNTLTVLIRIREALAVRFCIPTAEYLRRILRRCNGKGIIRTKSYLRSLFFHNTVQAYVKRYFKF